MKIFLLILGIFCFLSLLPAQPAANYDESRVPEYQLPDILPSSEKATQGNWLKRRKEILHLFEQEVYGKRPELPVEIHFEVVESDTAALSGVATRKQVQMLIERGPKRISVDLLIYTPNQVEGPVPLFLGYNFYGNHTLHPDSKVMLPRSWIRNNEDFHIIQNRATEASRGVRKSRWPLDMILSRGYGLAVMYYGDIDPDFDDGFQNGVHPLFYRAGQSLPKAHEWGSIAAWSWGLSKAMDYLETDPLVDESRVAVIGHSRLGKTSLWTGALDTRFAMVISNDSGCGGAALSRRAFGETVGRINTAFPHWFCENFKAYSRNEAAIPVDQHMLLALVAPRPLYVASASEDLWADPKGEFLSLVHASEVYHKVYDFPEMKPPMPAVNSPRWQGPLGYHLREGKHDINAYDWGNYLDFADIHLK